MRLWDACTGKPIGEPIQHEGPVRAVAFSGDSFRVVTSHSGAGYYFLQIRDAFTGAPIGQRLEGKPLSETTATDAGRLSQDNPVSEAIAVAFSPDGSRLLTADEDRKSRVWDATTGQVIVSVKRRALALALSPDGSRFLTGFGEPVLWDTATGQPVSSFPVGGTVYAVAFSSDGSRIATGCLNRSARIWDATTGQPLSEPLWHPGNVRAPSFGKHRLHRSKAIWNGSCFGPR